MINKTFDLYGMHWKRDRVWLNVDFLFSSGDFGLLWQKIVFDRRWIKFIYLKTSKMETSLIENVLSRCKLSEMQMLLREGMLLTKTEIDQLDLKQTKKYLISQVITRCKVYVTYLWRSLKSVVRTRVEIKSWLATTGHNINCGW